MAESTDEELNSLSVLISDKTNQATITLSKTDSQKVDLKGHKLKDYPVRRTYNAATKTISIRVTIPRENGNLYGYDIVIPSDGTIDADKTMNTDMKIDSDSIKFTVFKTNEFNMYHAV